MGRELSKSHRQLTTTERMIKELEELRKNLELLLTMFALEKRMFDRLIRSYFRLWQTKSKADRTLILLSPDEREYLESELGLKRKFEYYEEQIDYAIRRYGELITINKMLRIVNKLDELGNELKVHLKDHDKGVQKALPKIKDIIRKKVGPVLFGSALIAADTHLANLPTVIGGFYIIYNATVLAK